MKKTHIILALLLLCCTALGSFAAEGGNRGVRQSRETASATSAPAEQSGDVVVKGVIISTTDNLPLPGVAVYAKGQPTIGTTSGLDGQYSLSLPAGTKTVVFEALGYDKKEMSVSNVYLFALVQMIEQSTELDEVVVVGYGTQKRESLVGAVQAVRPEELVTNTSNLASSFAGNIAGMISRQRTGEPGYDTIEYYVRGVSTFGTNAAALIVLDGIEIPSTMLSNIQPETIASFSVLKDATATALYGSRGANGVIIINTKDGHNSEKMTCKVTYETTVAMPTYVQKAADAVTYMEMYNEAVYNDAIAAGSTYVPFYSQDQIEGTRQHLNPYIYPDNDWYSLLFKSATVNEHANLSMQGGSKIVTYFLNAAFFNESGIVRSPSESPLNIRMNNQKYLFQSNVTAMMTRSTKVSMKLNAQIQNNNAPYASTSDLFYSVLRANPARFPAVLPAEDGDTYVRYGNNYSWDVGATDLNPYGSLSQGYKKRYYSYLTAILSVDQNLDCVTKGLSASALASFYNYSYAGTARHITPYYFRVDDDWYVDDYGDYHFTTSSIGDEGNTYLTSWVEYDGYHTWQFQGKINYARTFGKHDVAADIIYQMQEKTYNATSSSETYLLPFREQGLAGRVTYNFDRRYYFEWDFGYNGSENFAKGHRWGFFPSVAIGWNISNEPFFGDAKDTVNNLKIRASYGQSGNDELSVRFPYVTEVSTGSRAWQFGNNFTSHGAGYITTYGNEDATWEVATKFNIGFDLELFRSLSLSADYFYEYRDNIFMQRNSLSATAGMESTKPYANVGVCDSRGVDISLEYNKQFSRDLLLQVRGTFTYAHNRVLSKDEPEYSEENKHLSQVGHPINAMRVLIAEGIFTSQEEVDNSPKQDFGNYSVGNIKYKDVNGDGIVDSNDYTWTERPAVPEIIYGFGASLQYKKWDFQIMFQGGGNYNILMYDHHPFCTSASSGYGIMQYIVDDHWSWDNNVADAAYPRLTTTSNDNDRQQSTFYLRTANYLRLKNVEIGVTLKSFRIYVQGSNLVNFSPFKYWDPEYGGANGLVYPPNRTITLGVQFNW